MDKSTSVNRTFIILANEIICRDCHHIEKYKELDDIADGWRILGPAQAYFNQEGYCPRCVELNYKDE